MLPGTARNVIPASLLFVTFLVWTWLTLTGRLAGFDYRGLLLFRDEHLLPASSDAVADLVILITHLGDGITLLLLSLPALGWLFCKGHRRLCGIGTMAIGGLFLISPVLKPLFGRARPDLVEHLVQVSSHSYPSGHALRSAGIYLILILLWSNFAPAGAKPVLLAAGVTVAIAVGLSRIYLGVHWPTDIIAGWIIAASWVVLWRHGLRQVGPSMPVRRDRVDP